MVHVMFMGVDDMHEGLDMWSDGIYIESLSEKEKRKKGDNQSSKQWQQSSGRSGIRSRVVGLSQREATV